MGMRTDSMCICFMRLLLVVRSNVVTGFFFLS